LVRDISVGFRGGLNQLILGADGFLKCGLGVVRNYAMGYNGRDRLGGITRIASRPGAKGYKLVLGTEDTAQLTFFEVDVPHVLHVGNYADYLHEAFHLVADHYHRTSPRIDGTLAPEVSCNPVMLERVMEVFALLLTRWFVFGNDVDAFVKFHLTHFARSGITAGTDVRLFLVQWGELLLRLFMAADAPAGHEKQAKKSYHREDHVQAMARFQSFLAESAPLLCEDRLVRGRSIWNGTDSHGQQHWLRFFDYTYHDILEYMPWVVTCAKRVYDQHVGALQSIGGPYDSRVIATMTRALAEGRPVVCGFLRGRHRGSAREARQEIDVEPMVVACRLLQQYLSRIVESRSRSIHLQRDPSTGAVEFPHGLNPWHEFLIDPGSSTMFSPVPEARRSRLRRQIVLLKSFWDISSIMRGRRLRDILRDNWP
jgi:hypothetical protein